MPPDRGTAARASMGPMLRRARGVDEAHAALAVLREAAAWASAAGLGMWEPAELREADYEAAAAADELVIGFEGEVIVATALLQTVDTVYWPEARPGAALYVHKVAVRRIAAGHGWLARLIDFAAEDARARGIPLLRLDTVLRPKLRAMYEAFGFRVLEEPPLTVYGRRVIRLERPA